MENTIDILLVEDTPSDVRLTQEALKKSSLSYRMTVKSDGVLAMEHLQKLKGSLDQDLPHLILLDLNMPRMNGHQVLEEIKADETLTTIPVILLTVSERDEDVLEALRSKMNYYVAKPITAEKISVLIKAIYELNNQEHDEESGRTREETHIRLVLAGNPHTSMFALEKLSCDQESRVRARVAANERISQSMQERLADDPDPEVRVGLCSNPKLQEPIIERLIGDENDDVRIAATRCPRISRGLLDRMTDDGNVFVADSARKALATKS